MRATSAPLCPPEPAINGVPNYSGHKDVRGLREHGYQWGAAGGTEKNARFVRLSMYGSFLSGGLGEYVYGAEGIWGADIEPAAPVTIWDAFRWNSGAQVKYLRDFALSIGGGYEELEPDTNLFSPNRSHHLKPNEA